MKKFVYDVMDGDVVVSKYGEVDITTLVLNSKERSFLVDWLNFVREQIESYGEDKSRDLAICDDLLLELSKD